MLSKNRINLNINRGFFADIFCRGCPYSRRLLSGSNLVLAFLHPTGVAVKANRANSINLKFEKKKPIFLSPFTAKPSPSSSQPKKRVYGRLTTISDPCLSTSPGRGTNLLDNRRGTGKLNCGDITTRNQKFQS